MSSLQLYLQLFYFVSLSLAKLICISSCKCICICICSLISRDINFCQICAELISLQLVKLQVIQSREMPQGKRGGAGQEAEQKLFSDCQSKWPQSQQMMLLLHVLVVVVVDDDDWHLGTAPQLHPLLLLLCCCAAPAVLVVIHIDGLISISC